ncbi:hypothetical protein [Acidovorax sp. SUPP2825]|uniref:hypothetical protein n=1 Tax=Acidovorax sp. SUPP2825 TaxID=2920879 RepID=UPI0023DE2F08|nr:hypothetical protein [Acidovorax sp. SUPP2825]GKS95582.1 hypothetical protein AVAK2825_13625 [Acidovorax sp. SUPP2825]
MSKNHASDAARMASQAGVPSAHKVETRVLWCAGQGQVCNAGVFVFALLFFWLVLPVGWALYRYLRTANHHWEPLTTPCLTNPNREEWAPVAV